MNNITRLVKKLAKLAPFGILGCSLSFILFVFLILFIILSLGLEIIRF